MKTEAERDSLDLSRAIVVNSIPYGPVVSIAAGVDALCIMAVSANLPCAKLTELIREVYAKKSQTLEDKRDMLETLGLLPKAGNAG